MANQASVTAKEPVGNGVQINSPAGSMIGNVAEFGHDLATLGELQAKLAVIDLKETLGRALVPAALAGAGVLLLAASLPVALLGVAELLASGLNLIPGVAMLLTALGALVLAGILAFLALPALKRSFASLERSRDELTRNVSWIKTVLSYSGRGPSRQKP